MSSSELTLIHAPPTGFFPSPVGRSLKICVPCSLVDPSLHILHMARFVRRERDYAGMCVLFAA